MEQNEATTEESEISTGEKIERLAKEHGMSLRQLAIKAGISYNTLYSSVRRKSNKIDMRIVTKIASALDMEVRDVLSYEQYCDRHMALYTAATARIPMDFLGVATLYFSYALTDDKRVEFIDAIFYAYGQEENRDPKRYKEVKDALSKVMAERDQREHEEVPKWFWDFWNLFMKGGQDDGEH